MYIILLLYDQKKYVGKMDGHSVHYERAMI